MSELMHRQRARSGVKGSTREALREALEAARAAFHALAASYSGSAWRKKSPTTDWTFGEVLVHLTWAIEYLPQEVARARDSRGMFNMPKFIADPASYWYIRWQARTATPDTLRRRYDKAIDATLSVLDTIRDDEWSRGANFYGEGFHSVEDLFRTPSKHIADHTAGWPQMTGSPG